VEHSILILYLRRIWKLCLVTILSVIVFGVVFFLWDLPVDAYSYSVFLIAFILMIAAGLDYLAFYVEVKQVRKMRNASLFAMEELKEPKDPMAAEYRELLKKTIESHEQSVREADYRQADLLDYYSMWVHQIKSPIAALRLMLQNPAEMDSRNMNTELFRIEQYVDMALQYMRLESMSSDLVLKKTSLLPVLRQSVRKFAPVFIEKRLSIDIEETDLEVVTDEKWVSVVFDQLLSNALKYTKTGRIRVFRDPDTDAGIIIEDTGIGIRPEDLPRVFERGFTGYNGRKDMRATGLGLYLSKKIMDRLSHKIRITSDGSSGTRVFLDFSQVSYKIER
jgi:signal transduction histidine kinase